MLLILLQLLMNKWTMNQNFPFGHVLQITLTVTFNLMTFIDPPANIHTTKAMCKYSIMHNMVKKPNCQEAN